MTYPTQGDNSGQDSYGQGSYGQGAYGQGSTGQDSYGQGSYGQGGYGAQSPSYSGFGGATASSSGHTAPPSNVGWAVAAIVFFWPLSFVAMTRALDVYPLWAAGRHAEAEAASATAKKFGTISLIVFAVMIVLYFVLVFTIFGLAASTGY